MSRSIVREVFIAAAPEAVWNAITTGSGLEQWFAPHARVEAGLGGSVWLSWGEGAEGTIPIARWEQGRRIGWEEPRKDTVLAVDMYVEAKDGGTLVRLVQSGFGDSADWDSEFHMTDGGWAYFLEHLRRYLENYSETPRNLTWFRDKSAHSRKDTFARIVKELGLDHPGGVEARRAGTRYTATTSDGTQLEGEILSSSPATGQLGLTIEPYSAILFIETEPRKENCALGFWFSTYHVAAADRAVSEQAMRALYDRAVR